MVSPKPWQLESTLQLLVRLFACFIAGSLAASAARKFLGDQRVEDSMLNLFIALASFQWAALGLFAFFLRKHQIGWTAAFGFKNNLPRNLLIGLAASVVLIPAVMGLGQLTVKLLAWLHFTPHEQTAVHALRSAHAAGQQIFLGLIAIVFAPIAEEMLFRGILYPAIKQAGFPKLALWGVAFFFAFIHGNVAIFLPLMMFAVALALLYEWTDNLLAPMLVHSLFNAANFAILHLGWAN